MTDKKFSHYIGYSVLPLFPDLEDTPEKRVLLKVDSGPGQNWKDLMNKAQVRGIYI